MDEAAVTRRAALEAVEDVEPTRLQDRIGQQLERGSMVPGALTILSVRALADGRASPLTDEGDSLLDPVAKRAAGVQLIYDGLRLTRTLAHDEPWVDGDRSAGDLDVLVADVLVARGFHLLARTEAAATAVETVRAFGQDQTVRTETDDASLNLNLEADVLELAVVAGANLGERGLSPGVTEFATEMAARCDRTKSEASGFPATGAVFSEKTVDRLSALGGDSGGESVTTSVDD
jgi:hypothetical protein